MVHLFEQRIFKTSNGMPLSHYQKRNYPSRNIVDGSSGGLGRNLLVRKCRNVGSLAGVLNGDPADLAVAVEVKDRVLIKIFGFSYVGSAKLNVQGVRILKVLDLHGVNERSKNALCTVSPSGRRMTLKCLPSASSIAAHRRIRPSSWITSFTG